MSQSPWPAPGAGVDHVLFIVDASHSAEESLLTSWLADTRDAAAFSGNSQQLVVRISRDPENIDASPLHAALTCPPETLVVPLRVAWRSAFDEKNSSPRFIDLLRGNPRRPGPSRARRILKSEPQRAVCLAAAPATLAELSERLHARQGSTASNEVLAEFVAGQAGLALDIAERRLRGIRYKVPRRVAQSLSASAGFTTALQEVADQTGKPVEALKAESASIMKELIAIPRTFWQDVLAAFNRKMISMGYDGNFVVDPDSLQRYRLMVRDNPSALLWTHKTHIDGFAIYSILFENDFPAPHVLGGVNMAFAGLGFLARRSGAIFIRRSFQDNLLYKMILRQYIGYLLEKRFPLTWAFEGTRSRVGKLMPPRYGILKYVLEAAQSSGADNLHIIPVAINYDLIGDVRDYANEQAGEKKRAESLRWFVEYLRGLRQPMGRIYIDFGEPVILNKAAMAEDSLAVAKIAFQVGVEVNRVSPITLASLVTMILLGASPRALTRDELGEQIVRMLAWARTRNIRATQDFDQPQDELLDALADTLVATGLITRYDEGPEVVYAIAPKQHAVANYYRNTTIHHFVSKAIAELALLRVATYEGDGAEKFWREAERLRNLFKFEFFYAPTKQFKQDVRLELSRYEDNWEAALAKDPEHALHLLTECRPLVAHAALLTFVEAYRLVADVLARLSDSATLSEKECVSQALAYGRQAYLQGRISSEASIGKLLFQNGYKVACGLGLNDPDSADIGENRKRLSRDLRRLAHRLDRIRAIALPDMQ